MNKLLLPTAVSAVLALFCLWMTGALLQIPGALLVAFCAASGAAFWGTLATVLLAVWRARRRDELAASKRSALRARLMGARS